MASVRISEQLHRSDILRLPPEVGLRDRLDG
jgi:hypothetical protein